MTAAEHVRMLLDLNVAGDPIQGRLILADDQELAFFGWLQLATALESVRAEAEAGRAGRSLAGACVHAGGEAGPQAPQQFVGGHDPVGEGR